MNHRENDLNNEKRKSQGESAFLRKCSSIIALMVIVAALSLSGCIHKRHMPHAESSRLLMNVISTSLWGLCR